MSETPGADPTLDPELAQHEAEVAAAQEREHDEEGDPNAEDLGAAEAPADADPEHVMPPSAEDDFADLDEGEDDGGEDDLDGDDDDEAGSDGNA